MKKISAVIILILALLTVYRGYGRYDEYRLIARGIKASNRGDYKGGKEYFLRAYERYGSQKARDNYMVNLYREEEYEKIAAEDGGDPFIRGNSLVYSAKDGSSYGKALENYKDKMREDSDINIRKNYEIVKKLMDEEEKKQEQKQEKKQDKDSKQEKEDNKDRQNNGNQMKQDETRGDHSQDGEAKERPEGDRSQDDGSPKDQGDEGDDKPQGEGSSGDSKETPQRDNQDTPADKAPEERGREEAMSILRRLEGNEGQAFRNNERMKEIGGDSSENSW